MILIIAMILYVCSCYLYCSSIIVYLTLVNTCSLRLPHQAVRRERERRRLHIQAEMMCCTLLHSTAFISYLTFHCYSHTVVVDSGVGVCIISNLIVMLTIRPFFNKRSLRLLVRLLFCLFLVALVLFLFHLSFTFLRRMRSNIVFTLVQDREADVADGE